ncbi:MAG: SusC/RagA family TonB-linked outer membrane protein [Flavobacterium sp. JAD_PAG50586_2]|nr:MAG: SusC/RagA family TonB-linked outer membrane protein [Flavobacterium sp. JAD_PAG50586_2]
MNKNSLYKARAPLLYALFISLVYCNALFAQNTQPTKITGTVNDVNGALPGVTVTVKGTANSTISDNAGKYSISAQSEDTLLFSFIGFKTIEIAVANRSSINATMVDDATTLKEVTINAGYYTVKDKERTGSISKITSKDISTQPVTNVLAAMQGRMAGVDITQTTGMPGGGFDIRIRGVNSLRTAGNSPLYIVDGVPFSSETIGYVQTSTNTPTPTSPLNTLTPSDIESIEVLKDADATAIYGSRGANGVVLITTKKGKAGKTQFTASASTATGQITSKVDMLSTPEYLAMRRKAFANDGIVNYPATAYDVNGTWDQTRNTDWQEELTGGTAVMTTVQASVSGGSAQTHFLLSGNSFSQSSVFPGDFVYKKKGVHVHADHESDDKRFKIAFSGSYDIQDNDQPARDLTRISRNLAPNAPALYDENGNLNWQNSTWTNPLAALNATALTKTNNLTTNTTLSYALPYGFTVKGNMGFTSLFHKETRTDPSTIYDPVYNAGAEYSSIYLTTTRRESWIVEPQLDWQRKLSEGKIDVLVGGTFQNQVGNRLVQLGSGFTSNSLIYNLASATTSRTLFDDETIYKYEAFFGRVNFSWKDKYIVNLTGRRDGSSRFGPGKQFANFGAVGAAWLFTEEKALKERNTILSFGKLRASYGVTGNDQIGDYQYLDTYQSSTAPYDGTVGLAPIRLFNPNFSWESNKKLEGALELGFFKDRIFFTGSYYRNRSSNQLIGMPLPGTTGFTSMQTNLAATVENTGLELTLRTVNIQKESFGWTTSFNISLPKNKLIAFPGLENSTYRNQYVIGESINIVKLYHLTGVNPTTGVYEFEDVNDDGILSAADDAQTVRDLNPEFFGGLQNTVRYKRFQLDFLFQFLKQLNWNAASQFPVPGVFANQPTSVLGAWSQAGDIASTQLYTNGLNTAATSAYQRYNQSDAAVSDASYIRLKNISISYNVPTHLKGLECRLNAQAQNLLTFTPYEDGDPEFRSFNYLPPLRVISFAAEIKF